jgi:hypothetical protein
VTAEDVPVKVEDRLSAALPDVDDDAVVLEPLSLCRVGDELEHALRLVGGDLPDLAEARDVPLWDHQQVDVRARVDVVDRDEAVRLRDVVAVAVELAEEAVVRQLGSPLR